jgi:signal transduction histidine kinase
VKRPVLILYILGIYVVLQFCWWAFLLVDLNDEVYHHKIQALHYSNLPVTEQNKEVKLFEKKITQRRWMVIGEGAVFLALLAWGLTVTSRAFRKEMFLAKQQKNFLLSITHEFKSPLASIKLYLQTLLRHELEQKKTEQFIHNALKDTERLNTLVENALLANLIDYQGYNFSKEEFNLSAYLRLTIQKFQQVPENKKINAQIEDGLNIFADKNAISVLLNNLLENAQKYSPHNDFVGVKLFQNDKRVVLQIQDNGIGIPEKEKPLIFTKFYRIGNEETRKSKGTGLGLFICKYITDKHDGSITVSDNQPAGSVFTITLPLIHHENISA